MTKLKFIVPILLLGILVLVETGCVGGIPDRDSGSTFVETVPTSDIAGEEISDIPRYPGSVRIYYGPIPNTNIIVTEYLTSASIDTVSDFYEAQLPANGWVSPTDEELMKEFGLTYGYVGQGVEKGEYQTIVLVRDSSDYSEYTNINITFGPKQ